MKNKAEEVWVEMIGWVGDTGWRYWGEKSRMSLTFRLGVEEMKIEKPNLKEIYR